MLRLLIVDDNESIHQDFKKVLKGNNKDKLRNVELELFGEDDPDLEQDEPQMEYRIDDAFQGQEAIDMVDRAAEEGQPYALIFMDVRMPPGIDGIKAASRIWRKHPDTEMVICTAHSDYSWGEMLKEIGISDKLQFLRKPFDMISVQQLALSCTKKWELARSTKVHIKELEEARESMARLNDELEHKVEQRTSQLSKTNSELQQVVQNLKTAQEQLVASEKMAALGGLVAGIAHEINTPVGVGVTAASHLEKKTRILGDLFESKKMKRSDLVDYLSNTREATNMILTNLNRASELIQSFKKVAVDQSCEERRKFKLKEYINEVLLSLGPKLKKTRHQVLVEGDDHLEINTYPGAFAQVISNFVMNSLIHAFEGDDKGVMEFKLIQGDKGVTLEYSDNGRGIPEEHQRKIFDPFFTTKRGKGGSGLGLHIVYNIATQTLGGQISCESAPGKGTTFKLTIPYEPGGEPNG